MGFALRVRGDSGVLFERKIYTEKEFKAVLTYCVSERRIGFFESTLITVRTDTFPNFCKDFFFPTLINHALKAHEIVLRILESIFSICLDILTFPIRLITIIPRYLYNQQHQRQDHPLYRYLLSVEMAPEALNVDHICLELQWAHYQPSEQSQTRCSGETFNFIQLPEFEGSLKSYLRISGILPVEHQIELLE